MNCDVIRQFSLLPFVAAVTAVTDTVIHASRRQPSRIVRLLEVTVEPENMHACFYPTKKLAMTSFIPHVSVIYGDNCYHQSCN